LMPFSPFYVIVLSLSLRFTASDYPFDIFNLFIWKKGQTFKFCSTSTDPSSKYEKGTKLSHEFYKVISKQKNALLITCPDGLY
jgi:hypothetical protein